MVVGDVPKGVVTTTLYVPPLLAGAAAVMLVAELTVKLVALVPPNVTALAFEKLFPVIVTPAWPAVVIGLGLTEATLGTGAVLSPP